MTPSPVVAHFDGVADSYDQVLPFFASFARQAAAAVDFPPDAGMYPETLPVRAGFRR